MGLNNTGKSTLATALYCAIRADRRRIGNGRTAFAAQRFGAPARLRGDLTKRLKRAVELDQSGGLRTGIEDIKSKILEAAILQYGRAFVSQLELAMGARLPELATRVERRYPLKITIKSENPKWELRMSLRGKVMSYSSVIAQPDPTKSRSAAA